jgi:hypothetical protein
MTMMEERMYVLKHSKRRWAEECKIKCPDCEQKMFDGSFFISIITQDHSFWKQSCATNYDMQYHAVFKCDGCGCMFKAWSHIIKDAGPPIGSGILGSNVVIKKWNGYFADRV